MRFIVIVKATKDSEAGVMPPASLFEEMHRFNTELAQAGTLVTGDGAKPSSNGVRIRLDGGEPKVTQGPFAQTEELLSGFWIVDLPSKEKAIELFSRCPGADRGGPHELEIRPLYEAADFADAAPAEVLEAEAEMRKQQGA